MAESSGLGGAGSRSIPGQYHGADALAAPHGGEAVVDALQRQARGDQLVELELTLEVAARQPGEVALGPRAAVARAGDLLLAHQRAPAEGDVLVDVDLAQEHQLPARPHDLRSQPETVGAT